MQALSGRVAPPPPEGGCTLRGLPGDTATRMGQLRFMSHPEPPLAHSLRPLPPAPARTSLLLIPAIGLLIVDLMLDLRAGGGGLHALGEGFATGLLGLAALRLIQQERREIRELSNALEAELAALRGRLAALPAAQTPQEPTQAPLVPREPPQSQDSAPLPRPPVDVTAAIDRAFSAWGLTPAEREVAWLLLKGASLAMVAEARGTSPRTAKDQARAIYRKSGAAGRAELQALALEIGQEVAEA
jgi:DNA-binding CsgD family transcriptional regulator